MHEIYIFNENRKVFGCSLKLFMKENGYTVERLADELGYEINTIKKWRSGDRVPSLETLSKIASLFNISVQRLYLPKSIYEKPLSDELKQIIEGKATLSEKHSKTESELREYCDYLFQKMLFSYLTPSEKKALTRLFVYYELKESCLNKLELTKGSVDFETFALKAKEYVAKQYGVSFPYKNDIKKSDKLRTEFKNCIEFKGGHSDAVS